MPLQNDNVIYKENLQVLYDIMSFYNDKEKVIIGGDFNASLVDRAHINAHKSELLLKFVNDNNLTALNTTSPTSMYTYTTYQTTIDYILFNKHTEKFFEKCDVIDNSSIAVASDHLPISFRWE